MKNSESGFRAPEKSGTPKPAADLLQPERLKRLKSGDHKAFDEIFLMYYTPVRTFLSSLVRDRDAGEELAQEVFVTLWETRERINPEGNFKGYIYRIARNTSLNFLRDKHAHKMEELEEEWLVSDLSSSDDRIMLKELQLLIDMIVSRMPKQRRMIYNMSRRDGMNNAEIAAELSITKNAVERHITFALNDLRSVLKFFVFFIG